MVEEEHAGLQLDACGGCGGVWFDLGELEGFVRAQGALPAHGSRERPKREDSPAEQCPRCLTRSLAEVRFRGVVLRACEGCQGMFVSREQLARIGARPSGDGVSGVGEGTATAVQAIAEFFGELLTSIDL